MSNDTPKNLKLLFVAIPAAIIGIVVLVIGLKFLFMPSMGMQMPPQPVILITAEKKAITISSEYTAQLEADQSVDLRARVNGFLMNKNVSGGEKVNKGDLLFQIEPDQYQATVENAKGSVISAKAQFDRATLDFNRISDLYEKKTSPKSDYDSSKAAYETARASLLSANAALTQAELNLGYCSIRAPFDGVVSDSPYSEGSLLGPESGVLATVVASDPILVTFGISDSLMGKFRDADNEGRLNLEDWNVKLRIGRDVSGNENFYPVLGKLTYTAPIVNLKTDTIKFKARFDNKNGLLVPGQRLTAIVESAKPHYKIVIPKECVLTDNNGQYVLVPKDVPADPEKPGSQPGTIAEMRRIVTDDEFDTEFTIKSGLNEGEKVISKGLLSQGATLRPGSPIAITSPEAASPQDAPKAEAK